MSASPSISTCCPNCSAHALGTETASVCTECAHATVAGASVHLPLLIAGLLVASLTAVAFRMLRRRANMPIPSPRPGVA